MTHYHVQLNRELLLKFRGIEADSAETAASIARGLPTESANEIADCAGENFAAVVAAAGDEQHHRSRTIEFEPERLRKAAPALLEACRMVVKRWERGDLAAAARACSDAVEEVDGIPGSNHRRHRSR